VVISMMAVNNQSTNFTADSMSQRRYPYYEGVQIQDTQIQAKLNITTIENIEIKERISQDTLDVQGTVGKLDKKALAEVASLVNISELSELLKMLTKKYPELGYPVLDVAHNPDTLEPVFIEITFPHGSWEEWRRVVKEVKKEMRKAGLENLVARVAITCLQGLRE